jgi:hypothetical protein
VLVLFALISFVLLASAALVIDLGTARLTQRQMQSAVDSAALEGLKFRDDVPVAWHTDGSVPAFIQSACPPPADWANYDPSDPAWQAWLDCARRATASEMVALAFDDDLDPGSGAANLGAGPTIDFSGSVSDPSLAAGQYMPPSALGVYKPSLQTNEVNAEEGDMVHGQYGNNAGYGQDPNPYARPDFSTQDNDGNPIAPANAPSFLVRMRRSISPAGANSLDDNPGVSSAGPTLPFLFARGSFMARSSANATDLTIQSGITVRATAISDARPTVVAGPASVANQSPGVAPFGVWRLYWEAPFWDTKNGHDTGDVATSGSFTSNNFSGLTNVSPQTRLATGMASTVPNVATSIGTPYALSTMLLGSNNFGLTNPQLYPFIPIYDALDNAASSGGPTSEGTSAVIVGFGYVSSWSYVASTTILTLQRPQSGSNGNVVDTVASTNASSRLVMPISSGLVPSDVDALFWLNTLPASDQQSYQQSSNQPPPSRRNRLLAPALVNH